MRCIVGNGFPEKGLHVAIISLQSERPRSRCGSVSASLSLRPARGLNLIRKPLTGGEATTLTDPTTPTFES